MPDQPAAKNGDKIVAVDTHIVMIPSPGGPVPTPMPMPFNGSVSMQCATTVMIADQPAALVGSQGMNGPSHVPQGGPFQKPPSNQATIQMGSQTVLANDKGLARNGDPAMTCNDPADAPNGKVIASGTVMVGG